VHSSRIFFLGAIRSAKNKTWREISAAPAQQELGSQSSRCDSGSNPSCSRVDRRYQVPAFSCSRRLTKDKNAAFQILLWYTDGGSEGLRGVDLNPRSALIPRKLLILRYAQSAKLAQKAIPFYIFFTLSVLERATEQVSAFRCCFCLFMLSRRASLSVTQENNVDSIRTCCALQTRARRLLTATLHGDSPLILAIPIRSCVLRLVRVAQRRQRRADRVG